MKTNSLWKTFLIGVCLLASWQADAKDYYLAPGGTGNGMAIDKPFGDPIKAFAALKAGDVLYVRGGTYHLSKTINVTQTGTADQRICVFAYPGILSDLSSISLVNLAPLRPRLPPIVASCTR